ncbi:MAG TPA: KH domain-containing protein [Candidatus Saccharimonadales bacterium]|nr:KH domain-containing protein [Candidatus Saccharimonadales bacterium]
MSEIDQQFIEYVVKSLVGKPDAVKIERRIDEKGVLLELTVDPEDLGRVIGKRGATAQSLRTLLRALGTKNDARYNLKIVDNGVGGSQPQNNDDSTAVQPDEESNQAEPVQEVKAVPAAEPEKPEPVAKSESTNDRLAQTRRELADLDDLDV